MVSDSTLFLLHCILISSMYLPSHHCRYVYGQQLSTPTKGGYMMSRPHNSSQNGTAVLQAVSLGQHGAAGP